MAIKDFAKTGYINGNIDGKEEIINILTETAEKYCISEDIYKVMLQKIEDSLAKDTTEINDSLEDLSERISSEILKEERVSPF